MLVTSLLAVLTIQGNRIREVSYLGGDYSIKVWNDEIVDDNIWETTSKIYMKRRVYF